MTVFIVIGVIGLVLLLVSLVFGELFDGLDADAGGLLSGPVIGAFLAAFGFGGALTMQASDGGMGAGVAGGLGGGVVVGGLAWLIVRTFMRMPTDSSFRSADLVGTPATVITSVPAGGLGEVTLVHLGQITKLSARADQPLTAGTAVIVTAVVSSSSVVVAPVGVIPPVTGPDDAADQEPPPETGSGPARS